MQPLLLDSLIHISPLLLYVSRRPVEAETYATSQNLSVVVSPGRFFWYPWENEKMALVMGTSGHESRLRSTVCLLASFMIITLAYMPPARADLYSAARDYKRGLYRRSFSEFLALARLGEPRAQLQVAYMYRAGRGAPQSPIHAYAWAMLASENGEAQGAMLAKQILPTLALAPGSKRVARMVAASYTLAVLNRTLLPSFRVSNHPTAASIFNTESPTACVPTKVDRDVYPYMAMTQGKQDRLLASYTLMPDGTAHSPRVIFGLPEPKFDAAVRTSLLQSKFARRPAGSYPIQCTVDFQFVERWRTASHYPGLRDYLLSLRRKARKGDPDSEAIYGTVLAGLPQLQGIQRTVFLSWLVKAAQAGVALAQYEVAASLESGFGGCVVDHAKALRWLHLAAAQNEADAEVALAIHVLRGRPDAARIAAAKKWLKAAAAQGNAVGEMYLSALLATSPQAGTRDPARALHLEKKAFEHLSVDPTGYEIRAAAYAAEGRFARAAKAERTAIKRARALRWNLSPLERRLALYRSNKPWYGNLLIQASPAPLSPFARAIRHAASFPQLASLEFDDSVHFDR